MPAEGGTDRGAAGGTDRGGSGGAGPATDRATDRFTPALLGGVALLERAVGYAAGNVRSLTAADPTAPTPCKQWDLGTLLRHVNDSMLVLRQAMVAGVVDPAGAPEPDPDRGAPPDRVADLPGPVAMFRMRAGELLGACAASGAGQPCRMIAVADQALTGGLLTGAGALEVAVHGWDLGRACGVEHPLPAALAEDLLALAPLLITPGDRRGRFAAPVPAPPDADPATRLLRYLGRTPG